MVKVSFWPSMPRPPGRRVNSKVNQNKRWGSALVIDKVLKALANGRISAETMFPVRPWRLRGVPTPRAARMRNPRFNALT